MPEDSWLTGYLLSFGPDVEILSYPLTAPAVIPFINCFWKIRKIISTGIIVSTDMARRLPQDTAYCPEMLASAS